MEALGCKFSRSLSWLTRAGSADQLVLPKQNPWRLWVEKRSPHYTWRSGWGSWYGFLLPWEKANPFEGLLCPRTRMHLVGCVEEWGYLLCDSRKFNLGKKNCGIKVCCLSCLDYPSWWNGAQVMDVEGWRKPMKRESNINLWKDGG